MLFTLLAFVIALGVLVTFHELGHYWVARRCGVRVLRFSVGFGKILLRRTDKNGTEWALSAIPLGGYVKMLDEPEPGANAVQIAQAFSSKTLAQRSAIVAAGPVANLLLAVLLYAFLNLAGQQEPLAIVAAPKPDTPAFQAGIQAGDRITQVNNTPVQSWNGVRWQLLDHLTSGGTVTLELETPSGVLRERSLNLRPVPIEPDAADPLAQAGIVLAMPRPTITGVNPRSPGEQAGLQVGDTVMRVGALDTPTASSMVGEIQKHPGQPVAITVDRGGKNLTFSVVPTAEKGPDGIVIGRIGVMLGANLPMTTVHHGPIDSFILATERTFDTVWLSLKMMGRMVTGDISLRNVSGPVTIADYAGQTARIGLASYIAFMALISVSIGVLNLLPIPMLDGGHLMYYAIEAVRGKPVSERIMAQGQRIGIGLLAALMGLAFFNDFTRLFS